VHHKQRQASALSSLLFAEEGNLIDALSSTELDVEALEHLVDEPSEEASADKPSTERVYGRDKNGQYRNHSNYVQLRNKINSQEMAHGSMFDGINARLSDDTFLQQAITAHGDVEIENEVQTEEDASAPAPQDMPNEAVFDTARPASHAQKESTDKP
jgi:hypothetical protein